MTLARAFALMIAGLCVSLTAPPALADPPRVVTDIAPVHSLVARVMQGVGEVSVILPPGASPHSYAMRPSQARALQQSELVFWIGDELTPWLSEVIEGVATGATAVALFDADGTRRLPFRKGALFDGRDHDHGHDRDHDHDKDHGQDKDHDRKPGPAAEHGDGHGGGHDHDGLDPHVWLDPENAKVWIDTIAEALSAKDAANAGAYRANAAAAKLEIDALVTEIDLMLAPVRDGGFVVLHDAYHYFEAAFFIEARAAISEADGRAPGARRVSEIRAMLTREGVRCAFTEPQFSASLLTAITADGGVRHGVLDPLGATLTPGPALYADILRGLGRSLADCLAP